MEAGIVDDGREHREGWPYPEASQKMIIASRTSEYASRRRDAAL
jgi:hypothetical protein